MSIVGAFVEIFERKILIVEDEFELREIISSLVKLDHINVEEAEDGLVAAEMLKKTRYSLVLSDIKMPRMNGIELFNDTKARGRSVPFIFVTAFGDQDNIKKALLLGAFDFIKKPFDESEVRDVVMRGVEVGHRRLQMEDSLLQKNSSATESIRKNEKMIRLLELKNFKRRA